VHPADEVALTNGDIARVLPAVPEIAELLYLNLESFSRLGGSSELSVSSTGLTAAMAWPDAMSSCCARRLAGRWFDGRAGSDGKEVAHYFDEEVEARRMLKRMLETVRPELANWAQMTASRHRSDQHRTR
jgi:hypothetical protein